MSRAPRGGDGRPLQLHPPLGRRAGWLCVLRGRRVIPSRAMLAAAAVALACVAACDRGPLAERAGRRQRALGGRLPPEVTVREAPASYAVGRVATAREIAALDVD